MEQDLLEKKKFLTRRKNHLERKVLGLFTSWDEICPGRSGCTGNNAWP